MLAFEQIARWVSQRPYGALKFISPLSQLASLALGIPRRPSGQIEARLIHFRRSAQRRADLLLEIVNHRLEKATGWLSFPLREEIEERFHPAAVFG